MSTEDKIASIFRATTDYMPNAMGRFLAKLNKIENNQAKILEALSHIESKIDGMEDAQ